MKAELTFTYDSYMCPIAASCSACGDKMLNPDPALKDPADVIMWFSRRYIEHRKEKHGSEPLEDA